MRHDATVTQDQPRDLWSFYDKVRDFQVRLSGLGHAEVADAIDRAMYGSTSGEILGDLGVALRRVADTLPEESARALDLLSFVDQALGPAG